MRSRAVRAFAWRGAVALAAAGLWLMLPGLAQAQSGSSGGSGITEAPIGGATDEGLPATTIAPAEEAAPAPAPSPVPRRRTPTTRRAATAHRATASAAPVKAGQPLKFEVEPAQARLRLKKDTPIYAQPSNKSRQLEQGQAGKFVVVTGSTHYFLRVKLKSGQEGYVLIDTVDMVSPADKLFMLTHDAPVLDAPNRFGKKLAEVHHGHAVHVVGISLNYLKIKMHSGLEGFIPSSALE